MKNDVLTAPAIPSTGYVSMARPTAQGHRWTYAGLWLFTALLIFRPSDLSPALASLGRLSFVVAALTLFLFCITQIWMEGRLSARPLEVSLVLALVVAALVSARLGVNPDASISVFLDVFIKAVLMFLVMVNAVRSEKRLHRLLWLALAAGVFVSWGAVSAYRSGQFTDEGYRVRGSLGATLNDPNDTALFLVTMIPIAVGLMLGVRARWPKVVYAVCIAIMLGGIIVTYSRGGFLALSCASAFLCWKLFRRAPLATSGFIVGVFILGLFLVPGNYADRLASITDPDLDTHGSAFARRNLLERSIEVAQENPLHGVGMGNFHEFSIRNQVSHNAYTQVAAEMGMPTLVIYLAFILAALFRMRRVERETEGASYSHEAYGRIYYLAMGLQASFLGFMVGSFFLSVAYYWFIYYLVGYAVCLGRIYETGPGRILGAYRLEAARRA